MEDFFESFINVFKDKLKTMEIEFDSFLLAFSLQC